MVHVSDLTTRRETMDDLEQHQIKDNIRISGLPEITGENTTIVVIEFLRDIMNMNAVIYSDIVNAHRIGKKSNDPNTKRDIIVKFKTNRLKSDVMRNQKRLRELKVPVYINDCLTRYQSYLFKCARDKKREKYLHSAWTRDGVIFVKLNENSPPKTIFSEEDLNAVISLYENKDLVTDATMVKQHNVNIMQAGSKVNIRAKTTEDGQKREPHDAPGIQQGEPHQLHVKQQGEPQEIVVSAPPLSSSAVTHVEVTSSKVKTPDIPRPWSGGYGGARQKIRANHLVRMTADFDNLEMHDVQSGAVYLPKAGGSSGQEMGKTKKNKKKGENLELEPEFGKKKKKKKSKIFLELQGVQSDAVYMAKSVGSLEQEMGKEEKQKNMKGKQDGVQTFSEQSIYALEASIEGSLGSDVEDDEVVTGADKTRVKYKASLEHQDMHQQRKDERGLEKELYMKAKPVSYMRDESHHKVKHHWDKRH